LRTPIRLDRARLIAFLASGVTWITGVSLGLHTGLFLGLIAAGYVAVASLALALASPRTGMTLAVLWGSAVALWSLILFPLAGLWLSLAAGLIIGTVCFGVWMGAGFLLLHAFGRQGSARGNC
jgi:hypothetical protein